MNEQMKLQIQTVLVSVGNFRNGLKVSALKNDGIIDKEEEKILRKAEEASEKYEKALKKLLEE